MNERADDFAAGEEVDTPGAVRTLEVHRDLTKGLNHFLASEGQDAVQLKQDASFDAPARDADVSAHSFFYLLETQVAGTVLARHADALILGVQENAASLLNAFVPWVRSRYFQILSTFLKHL